jgi:hypothetical protein
VVGYSLLMGRDDSGTLAGLKAHRRVLIDPKKGAPRLSFACDART